jgi:Co/Zn/Cd efflux system component
VAVIVLCGAFMVAEVVAGVLAHSLVGYASLLST